MKGSRPRAILPLAALAAALAGCGADSRASRAHLRDGGLPVLRLSGTPYEIGHRHGTLLRNKIRDNYANVFRVLAKMGADSSLEKVWNEQAPYVPQDYLEEMRGLSDGSGISLEDVHRIHAIPDAFPALCAGGAFFGPATADGRLYQLRNLDWERALGVQNYGAVFAVSPTGKRSFVNLGFVGFIGVLSGMNERGIAVGQVGSSSMDEGHQGTSFPFLLRRILEEADSAAQAALIVRGARRTVGINYVVGSAIEKRAAALETTARHFAQFGDADPAEAKSPYAVSFKGAVIRADTAFDPVVRHLQTCSRGDPKKEGMQDPHGDQSYDVRYLGQSRMVKENYGRIGAEQVFDLAKKIAPPSNIQSVVFAYPEFWVSYGLGDSRAADGPYHHFNLQDLLSAK